MRKVLSLLFVISFMVLSASEVVPSEVVPSLDMEVVGVNREQIDERNVDSSDIGVDRSSVNSSSSERFRGDSSAAVDRISITQTGNTDLENELSSKPEKSGGAAKWIIGVLGVAALIIML